MPPHLQHVFSRLRQPLPFNQVTHTGTLPPMPLDMVASGQYFHGFGSLSIENLYLSDDHKLDWVTDRLHQYGPTPLGRHATVWDTDVHHQNIPEAIDSENDTMMSYVEISLIKPALTAAVFIRAQHLGLTSPDSVRHPRGHWRLVNCSSTGESGRGDYGVIRTSNVPLKDQCLAAVIEIKTSRVCRSNGTNIDDRYQSPIHVLQYLPEWLERRGGYIPMDESGSPSTRTDGAFEWYERPWQKKTQKILFQVRSHRIGSDHHRR
jgi:hypothetical protein